MPDAGHLIYLNAVFQSCIKNVIAVFLIGIWNKFWKTTHQTPFSLEGTESEWKYHCACL